MTSRPVTQQSAFELLDLLRTNQISALELAGEYIRQIERLDPQINALVDFDPERVREQARVIDNTSGQLSPLAGLPVTVKSSISTAGHRCEIGSLVNQGNLPTKDATVVARLRKAGAVILGTTNCPEYLMAYLTENDLHGRTNNPWNLDYTPGGSSGGESAAIAAGMSAGGLGSDSGGSVRFPAHCTGICSLKPTPGRIPGEGHLPPCVGPFSSLGAIGPMARTIGDVTLLFHALSGQDPVDPVSPPVPLRTPALDEVKRIPVGFFEDDGLVPVTPETRQAVDDATEALRSAGFEVRPFRPKALEAARKLWELFFVRCGAMFEEPLVRGHEDKLSQAFRDFLERAHRAGPLTAEEILSAWAEADIIRRVLLGQMQQYPLVLCPVSAVPAFKHEERSWVISGQQVEYLDAMRYTQWWNLLAAPAAVVPVGGSPEGLPIGVQLIGRPFEDEVVLKVASLIDHEFGYIPPPIS
jgi:Asp-tRNA(Asn)/Glu-tRNA(Gln) amidotransferase A subunit family amidase